LTPPTVTVAICAYTERRWGAIGDAVASVRAQTHPPLETLLVIDNNESLRARAQRELDGVRVLANTLRPGLSGARNTALVQAAGEVVAFLDDDATVAPDWLGRIAAAYARPSVLAAGGVVRPRWPAGRPEWFPEEFDWVVGCSYRGLPETERPVRNLIGANMSVRRAPAAAVGGFNAQLGRIGAGHGGTEETELCIRLGQRDPAGEIVWLPAAIADHTVTPERTGVGYFVRRCRGEGNSKAALVRFVGSSGTATERGYVARTLPAGVARALRAALAQRRPARALPALAIVLGLATTVLGYVEGLARLRMAALRGAGLTSDRHDFDAPALQD
jgi:glycosyltransferase involved in cell wall biosynthesis